MNQKYKVLVVDDEVGCRESLRLILEDKYQITTLENGREALNYIATEKPDMVILDILMPYVDGIEVLRRIREMSLDTEVAIVTAYASIENARDAIRYGASDYLIKPFNKEDVEKIVEKGILRLEERRRVKESLESSQKSKVVLEKKIEKIEKEKKELTKQITLTKEYLECLIESSIDAIITTDIEGTINFFSKGAQKLYGYSTQEIVGNPFTQYCGDNPGKITELIKKLKKTGKLQNQEIEFVASDGSKIPSIVSASFLKDGNNKIIGILVILRDISDQKRLQEQVIQAERLKALGEMAAGVAHDFNNVLSVILGRAQLLQMQGEQQGMSAIAKGLEVIKKAALDGADIVRRIQEFARTKKERTHLPIDLNQLILEIKELTKPRWKDEAQQKGIKIEFKTQLEDIPPIGGISSELKEVFTNLIFNAVDALPQGGTITISSHLVKDDSLVEVQVKDTGIGMSAATRLKAFEPFFTTKGPGNSGLGLSMSYGIITAHGGNIAIDSQEGQGTTFTIHLPITTSCHQEVEDVTTISSFAGERILIIEDEEEIGMMLSEILDSVGCQATWAKSGQEGLDLFSRYKYDLVITDLGMPEISGWKVAQKIKELSPQVPVILVTGWDIEMDEQELKENGVDLVVHKPWEMNKILQLIKGILTPS
jgi:PAS domain S-box-containing protein